MLSTYSGHCDDLRQGPLYKYASRERAGVRGSGRRRHSRMIERVRIGGSEGVVGHSTVCSGAIDRRYGLVQYGRRFGQQDHDLQRSTRGLVIH